MFNSVSTAKMPKVGVWIKAAVVCGLFVCINSQDEPTSSERCLEGSSSNGVGNFTLKDCDLSSQRFVCESRISVNGDNLYVERKCKQRMACMNNERNNKNHCYSSDAISKRVRTCYYCCNSDLCNDFDTILPLETPTPTPTVLDEDEFDV